MCRLNEFFWLGWDEMLSNILDGYYMTWDFKHKCWEVFPSPPLDALLDEWEIEDD